MQETIPLYEGDRLPQVGLGLWKVDRGEAAEVVLEAAKVGYRHFDSACDYGNELEVGQGIARAISDGICRREDLWITSKLWNTYHAREHVRPAAERSLRDLQLDCLDLYLIHFPIALRYVPFEKRYPPDWFFDPEADTPRMELVGVPIAETWGAMEDLVRDGLVRRIGVCNFGTALLRDLLAHAEIQPAVLQVEMHPYLTQNRLLRFCEGENIAVTAFSPLGAPSYVPLGMADAGESALDEAVVRAAAAAHGKSPAQIVLRWAIQRGIAVIPKSRRPERLRENLDVFDFALASEEMDAITALNRNRRFNDPGEFGEKAFHTFVPIFD